MRTAISISLILAALAAPGCAQVPQETREVIPKPLPTKGPTALAADSAPKQLSEKLKVRTDQLLKQLGPENYREREAAQAELGKLITTQPGFVLAHLLLANEAATDPEVKQRLERILRPYRASRRSMRTAIEVIRTLSSDKTRSALFPIVRDKQRGWRRALDVLIEKRDPAVVQQFVNLLKTGCQTKNYDYIWRCEYPLRRMSSLSVGPLSQLLRETDDPLLAEQAAGLLTEMGREAHDGLVEILHKGNQTAREALFKRWELSSAEAPFEAALELSKSKKEELRALSAKLLARSADRKAVALLLTMLNEDKAACVRAAAAEALSSIGGKRVVPALLKALDDPDPGVRANAATGFMYLTDNRALKPLLRALRDPKESVAGQAVWALLCFDNGLQELIKAYKDASPGIRTRIVYLLCRTEDRRAIPFLRTRLKDDNWGIRELAARGLHNLHATEAVDDLLAALKDENAEVRSSAASALGSLGHKRAAGPLMKMLNDKEKEVRSSAAWSLGWISDRRAVPALIKALNDEYFLVRCGAVISLGRIGDERVFEPLVEYLGTWGVSDNDLPEALFRTGGKKAIPHIIKMFKGDSDVQSAAIRTILRFGEDCVPALLDAAKSVNPLVRAGAIKALAMLREEKAFSMILEALSHEDGEVRLAAAQAAVLYRNAAVVEPLIGLIKDKKPSVRAIACRSLGEICDKRAVAPLIFVLLEDENEEVSTEAAQALGTLKDSSAIESLILSLLEDHDGLRRAAAKALASFGDKRVTRALAAALADDDWLVRRTAAFSLVQTGDKSASEAIEKAYYQYSTSLDREELLESLRRLKDPDNFDFFLSVLQNRTRSTYGVDQVIYSLGESRDARAVEILREFLEDTDREFRLAAAVALLNYSDADAVRILAEALKSENTELREEAVRALEESPHARALPWLVESLGDSSYLVRHGALVTLGKLGDRQASPALIAALGDGRECIREAAVKALAKLKEESAVQRLIKLLENDPADDVRQAAHDALREITGQNFGWNFHAWRRWYENGKNK